MRKELLLAIFVGMTLGLIITFGVYQSRENSKENKNNETDNLIQKQMDSDSDQGLNNQLSITTPEENLIVAEDKLIVSGTSKADSFIIIFVNDQENITTSDESGNFSIEVELDEGGNYIEIHSVDEDGNAIQKEKTVILDPDFLSNEEEKTEKDKQEETEE